MKILLRILPLLLIVLCTTTYSFAQVKKTTPNATMTYPSKTVSISINKPKADVYTYVSNPAHFPDWLGLTKSIRKQSEGVWTAQTDLGTIKMEFVPANNFGVIDHVVTLPDGSHVNNTLRVIANGEGAEVSFTLFQLPGKTPADFEKDAASVTADLGKLKRVLEGK